MIAIHPISLGISLYLAISGFRKGSLSASGAVGAVIAGYASMGNDLKVFGVMLIVFYLVGSKATKYKAAVKATLEDGHEKAATASNGGAGGNRSASQVACNTLSAVLASLAWRLLFSQDAVGGRVPLDLSSSCAVLPSPHGAGLVSRALVYAAIGHYGCCFGDTLASELGILSRSPPRLVTSLRRVPAGTNGAVSLLGLALSALGGFVTALTCVAALLVENAGCRATVHEWAGDVFVLGLAAGLGGSLLDSVLGATLQRTWFSNPIGKVLTERPSSSDVATGVVKVISGYDVLSNSQINLISGVTCAAAAAWWSGTWLICQEPERRKARNK